MPTKLKKSADGRLFVSYECPDCGANLRNRAEEIGRPGRCKYCEASHTIPGLDLYQAYLESQSASREERNVRGAPPPRDQAPSRPLRLGIEDELDNIDPPPARIPRATSQTRSRSGESRLVTLDDERDATRVSNRYDSSEDDYVRMTALPGEKVRLRFGPATAAVVGLQVLVGLGTLLWILAIVGVILTGRNDFRDRPGTAFGGTLIMAVYGFCILVLPWLIALLRVWNRIYVITDQRILSKSGLASLNVQEVRTESVSGLSVKQSIFGRIFGFGTVHVYADGTNLRIFWVDHPVAIAAAVRSVVEPEKG